MRAISFNAEADEFDNCMAEALMRYVEEDQMVQDINKAALSLIEKAL